MKLLTILMTFFLCASLAGIFAFQHESIAGELIEHPRFLMIGDNILVLEDEKASNAPFFENFGKNLDLEIRLGSSQPGSPSAPPTEILPECNQSPILSPGYFQQTICPFLKITKDILSDTSIELRANSNTIETGSFSTEQTYDYSLFLSPAIRLHNFESSRLNAHLDIGYRLAEDHPKKQIPGVGISLGYNSRNLELRLGIIRFDNPDCIEKSIFCYLSITPGF